MSWPAIARRDVSVTVAARSVKVLLGLLVAGVGLLAYIYPLLGADPITTARFSGFVHGLLTTLIPFAGVLLGYNAVVSDRESGAIRLTLSLPQSRRDLLLGTYASRTGLLTAAVLSALALGGALVVYPFGDLELGRYLVFVALTVAFGAVWSGLGLAVSLAVATGRRALVLGFGLVFLFAVVWNAIERALTLGLSAAGVADGDLPAPIEFLVGLEPGRVFERTTAGFVDPGRTVGEAWYLDEWVALGLLALWAVGPLGLAYARFRGRDLA